MAKARAVKFCVLREGIKSCQRDDKSPQKGRDYTLCLKKRQWRCTL